MVKIAVASTDGKVVNQHFGKADKFSIFEVNEETFEINFLEVRETNPICYMGDHDENALENLVKKLSDCKCILASRVGIGARNKLESYGIEVYEMPGIITESIDSVIRYRAVQKLFE